LFSDIVSPIRSHVTMMLEQNSSLRRTRDLLLPRLISGELNVDQAESDDGVLSA